MERMESQSAKRRKIELNDLCVICSQSTIFNIILKYLGIRELRSLYNINKTFQAIITNNSNVIKRLCDIITCNIIVNDFITITNYPITIADDDNNENIKVSLYKEDFVPAWVANTTQYGKGLIESIYDQKILGIPLFFANDEWPMYKGYPMSFYTQFIDPSMMNDALSVAPRCELIQIYIADLHSDDGVDGTGEKSAYIRKIPLIDIITKEIVIPKLPKTNTDIVQKYPDIFQYIGKITSWNYVNTFIHKHTNDDNTNIFIDSYEFHENLYYNYGVYATHQYIDCLLQIQGVPPTICQNDYLSENNTYYNSIYNGYWFRDNRSSINDDDIDNHGGCLNLTENGEVHGDI